MLKNLWGFPGEAWKLEGTEATFPKSIFMEQAITKPSSYKLYHFFPPKNKNLQY